MTRAEIAEDFGKVRTDRDLRDFVWRVVDYRDRHDPDAQRIIDALRNFGDGLRDYESAKALHDSREATYQAWLDGMRHGSALPTNLHDFEEYKVHARRTREYVSVEQWFRRVQAMTARLLDLWAGAGR